MGHKRALEDIHEKGTQVTVLLSQIIAICFFTPSTNCYINIIIC